MGVIHNEIIIFGQQQQHQKKILGLQMFSVSCIKVFIAQEIVSKERKSIFSYCIDDNLDDGDDDSCLYYWPF